MGFPDAHLTPIFWPSEGRTFRLMMRCDEIVRVFAPISLGERRYQPLLLRLAVVLRNAIVTYGQFITHYNYWRKTTWPEFQPSLPPGQLLQLDIAPLS